MKMKYLKGEYPYLKEKKRSEILRTLLYFVLSFLIFLVGFYTTKTKANYLTIVAVLGCLPASKSAVSAIMYCKMKECSGELYKSITERFEGKGSYNLYFTSYDKNYPISHLFVKDIHIIAYTEDTKIKENDFEEHIKLILSRDGKKGYHVKLYKDKQKYLQRLEQLYLMKEDSEEEEKIRSILHSVSL